jgi:CRISPR-associated protein Cas6
VLGPDLHEQNGVGLFAIRGMRAGPNELHVRDGSHLRIRTPAVHIPALLALAGKRLDVEGHAVRLGPPRTYALVPATTLAARMVTIKGFQDPEAFLEAVHRQLEAMKVQGRAVVPQRPAGPHKGEATRRILRIKDKSVVGFGLLVTELSAEESLIVQEKGIGGRRHMGCGLFLPARARKE